MRPVIVALILALTAFSAWAEMPGNNLLAQTDITELSLEALMDITVTIASRKEEKLSDTAAATFVITQEDIRRSGVTRFRRPFGWCPVSMWPESIPITGPFPPEALTNATQINYWS